MATRHPIVFASALLGLLAAEDVTAQLANSSAAALGMGENYTAVARGYAAIAWNPAALGLFGNPHTSGMIGTFRIGGGLEPLTLSDISSFEDAVVPDDVRADWLARIVRAGGQTGANDVDMTWATVQSGRFGLQVSSSARAIHDVSPGLAELVLFGNVNADGTPRQLDLSSSRINAQLYTTFGLSFGWPVVRRADATRVAVGATAKYTIGHALAVTETSMGRTTADPLTLQLSFPIAYTPVVRENDSVQLKSGGGFGVDVGVAYEAGSLTLAAVVQNVINSFAWDPELLRYRPAALLFDDSTRRSAVDARPLSEAPASLRERVAALEFKPALALGAQLRYTPALSFAADIHLGGRDGMLSRPATHVGAGAEYRALGWLGLQLGGAYLQRDEAHAGYQVTGGVGVQLGGFLIAASGGWRDVERSREKMLMITLLSNTF